MEKIIAQLSIRITEQGTHAELLRRRGRYYNLYSVGRIVWLYNIQAMIKRQKTLSKILAGSRNVSFDEFRLLVESFGFRLSRVR